MSGGSMSFTASDPSLEASNAEVASLARAVVSLPILPMQAITEPDGEIQIG